MLNGVLTPSGQANVHSNNKRSNETVYHQTGMVKGCVALGQQMPRCVTKQFQQEETFIR